MDEGMNKPANLRLLAWWLLVLAAIPASAAPPEARFAISLQRVTAALRSAGVPATSAQVKFLSPVSSITENSDLDVVNVSTWTGNRTKVELRCHDHRACLPFYVLLSQTGTAEVRGAHSIIAAANSGSSSLIPVSAAQMVIRNGDPATLVFEGTALRITLPVICLEGGGRGQKIRVVSTDHKRFFKAEVVQAGLLRATL
jgi:hypothetical protein